jgi:hypothetical protein
MNLEGNELLWLRALAIAESMDEPGGSLKEIEGYLHGLDEGFAGSADPVDNFPAYVTVRLCRSMAKVLRDIDP